MGCPLSLNHLLSMQLLAVCFFAVFRGLPSAVDRYKGIGDNGYDNAFSQSLGLLFLAENESKDPMISRFALIVAVLLPFASTFEQTRDLNDFFLFLAIKS